MSRKRILIIAKGETHVASLVSALGDAEIELCPDVTLLPAGTLPHRCIFYVLDGDLGINAELLGRLHPKAQVIALSPHADLRLFSRLLRTPGCNHALVLDGAAPMALSRLVQKMFTGDIFGIEKYLPASTGVELTRLHDFAGRCQAIDDILKFAEQAGVRRKLRTDIGQVCEELLMNALYDAPIDASGARVFGEVSPKDRLTQQSPRPVSIRFAATPEHFMVAVRDRFGMLQKNIVLDYLDKCLNSSNQIDRKTYGAGLGLYLIANAATHLMINVARGIATEVICAFDRQTKTPLRMLSVFEVAAEQRVG